MPAFERNPEVFELHRELMKKYRKYNDSAKYYAPEGYFVFMKTLIEAQYLCRTVEDMEKTALHLEELEKALVPIGDADSERIYLWPGKVPCPDGPDSWKSAPDPEDFRPFMTPYIINDGKKHPTFLVLAGGSRSNLNEGDPYCEFFNSIGYNAFLMAHRVGDQPLSYALDLQRAVRTLRARADELGVDPARIGAVGSSFGGVVITGYVEKVDYDDTPSKYCPDYADDAIDAMDGRLGAFCGIYTSSHPYKARDYECRYDQYPPTWLAYGGKDFGLKFQIGYLNDLVKNGVRAEAHLFDGMEHGFGLGTDKIRPNGGNEHIPAGELWPKLFSMWLERIFA